MKKFSFMISILMILLILGACSSTQSETADTSENNSSATTTEKVSDPNSNIMAEEKTDQMSAEDDEEEITESDEMASDDDHDDMSEGDEEKSENGQEKMGENDDAMAMLELPAWQQITLANARTGEPFSLADYSGKTIFVEPMATWCTNCRRQLANVGEARNQINDENVIFIGLSLETNISDDALAQYQSDFGFDWTFAVMTPELLQQLADTFGRSITSAPSTPHFIIRPDGSYTDLVTGIDSAEQILQQIQLAQG